MAALTKTTNAVKDGNGTIISTVGTCSDGTNTMPSSGILGADGTHFLPSMDDPTRPGYVSIASLAKTSQITVTRPANMTPYTALDVVGGAITFTNAVPAAGEFFITDADLRLDITAIPSGMTSFRLYMYNVTPPSAIVDNAAWDLPSGDRASFLGYVDYGTVVDLGSTCYVQAWGLNKRMQASSTSLFGYLVTNGGFTPAANSEVYTPRIATVPA